MPYAVTVGMQGGYMPDTCHHFRSRKEANDLAIMEAELFRNDWDANYRVEGSARKGLYTIEDLDASEPHLGWVIEISEICEEDYEDYESDDG